MAEICEVAKISERSEEKFSEFSKYLVVRSAEELREILQLTARRFAKYARIVAKLRDASVFRKSLVAPQCLA